MEQGQNRKGWLLAISLAVVLAAVGCGDDGAQDGKGDAGSGAGAPNDPNRPGANPDDGVVDPGGKPGATETNGAAAPCKTDEDCPLTSCGPANPDGSRFCESRASHPPGHATDEDAGV